MQFSTRLKDFDNSWYKPGSSSFKRFFWYVCNQIIFKSGMVFPSGLKVKILKIFGAKVGKGVVIKPHVNIKYPWNLTIGDYTWIGENVWIDNLGNIDIGSNVCISQGAMLLCGNHNFRSETFDLIVKDIVIEEGVWIGAQTVVCPGVHCYSHSVLTVGSVASNDLEAFMIYQGNPAMKIKARIKNL